MAEYSKQYCDLHFQEMLPGDFDIEEIAEGLSADHYTPIICEGFGFVAIGKTSNGEIILAFPKGNDPESEIEWKSYNELMYGKQNV